MVRPFFVLIILSLLFSACTQRLICPAYQSAFIYDKNELRKQFSYFQEDSTPKILVASKTKFLIAEPMSYRKKLRSMQTIAMKPVNPVLPDSMTVGEDELMGEDGVVPGAELDQAARSVIDSIYIEDVPVDTTQTYVDSIYVITKDKELRLLKYNRPDSLKYDEASGKYVPETPEYVVNDIRYNVEQDNYMWYLRNSLVLPDVRLSQLHQSAQEEAEKKASKAKKKGFFGFFKNLFKKKEKEQVDTTEQEVQPKPIDDFDYVENDSIRQHQQDSIKAAQPSEKKGAFSFLKKKDKGKKQDASKEEEDKPKKKRREKNVSDEAETKPEEEAPIIEEDEDATDSF
jgi:hypothetical protein